MIVLPRSPPFIDHTGVWLGTTAMAAIRIAGLRLIVAGVKAGSREQKQKQEAEATSQAKAETETQE